MSQQCRCSSPSSSRVRAFTLVELLVVIGIIALLISVLMPALSRARQAANLIDCQARLHTMGQALYTYTAETRGLLPWCFINHVDIHPDWKGEPYWEWELTLTQMLNRNAFDSTGRLVNPSGVFRDKDTIEAAPGGRWINHYTCNTRLFYESHVVDNAPDVFNAGVPIPPRERIQRKISSVRRPGEVFLIWDGPQAQNLFNNTYAGAASMDGWAMDARTAYCFGSPRVTAASYDRPSPPGSLAPGANGKALQKKYNIDLRHAWNPPDGWTSHMRFRHMSNTTLAALCLDGHVTTRRVGEFLVKNYCSNYK